MSYDVAVQSKIEKISVAYLDELNQYLDYLIYKSQENTEKSQARAAYQNLLSFVGKINVQEDYKEELAKSRTERYENID